MKAVVKTKNAVLGWRFSRAVTSREDWKAGSNAGGMSFYGSGSTRTGRSVDVRIDFDADGGEASIVVDAPESKGGFLGTILEEVLGQGLLRCDTAPGVKPTELPATLSEVYVEVDGQPKGWQCVPCAGSEENPETTTIWWWTVG
jgi:hypothetical protein